MGLRKPDRDDARDAFGSGRSGMRTPVQDERGRQQGRPYSFNRWERARRLEPEDLDRLTAFPRPTDP